MDTLSSVIKGNIKTVYIDDDKVGTIICERCGKTKKVSNINSSMKLKPVAVNCICGNRFFVILDERKYYRKRVTLKGSFKIVEDDKGYPMIVENISIGGIRVRTPYLHKLKEGLIVKVEFNLDNVDCSIIERNAIVKHINGSFAGLQFLEDRSYDKILGFYLLK